MVRRWNLLVAGAVGVLLLGACSSDKPSSSTGDTGVTTTTGVVSQVTTPPTTGTTTPTSATTATPTTAAGTTQSSTATATTIAGRVVTSPSDNVKIGDSGKGVEQIQTALKAKGYKVTVDGKFGPQTDTAVKAFQKKNGLAQDGVVGPKTWAKLSSSSSSGSGATTTTTKSGGTATTAAATTTTIKA